MLMLQYDISAFDLRLPGAPARAARPRGPACGERAHRRTAVACFCLSVVQQLCTAQALGVAAVRRAGAGCRDGGGAN
jgi:hypothetical protein